jgi:hypothetical protein
MVAVATKPRTNRRAIASVVWAFFWLLGIGSLLALYLGITAKRQIDRSPEPQKGRRLANVGIAIASIELIAIAPGSGARDLDAVA